MSRDLDTAPQDVPNAWADVAHPPDDVDRAAREHLRLGARATVPVIVAYVPFGLTIGAAMANADIPALVAWASSPLLFGGAGQLLAVQLLGAGAASAVTVLAALVVNARFLLYSAALAPHVADWPRRGRWAAAYLLADPVYALTAARFAAQGEAGLDLRRDIARQIRRFRPDVLITATYDLTYRMAGQHVLNQADHRAVGVAVLDAARDAGNRWIFPELLDQGFEPWGGVGHVYVMGSNEPSHAVDVTDHLDAGVNSLRAHEAYLSGLGRDFDPEAFVRGMTAMAGPSIGVPHAVAFGRIQLQGV